MRATCAYFLFIGITVVFDPPLTAVAVIACHKAIIGVVWVGIIYSIKRKLVITVCVKITNEHEVTTDKTVLALFLH